MCVEAARGGSAGLVIPVTLRPSAMREREVRRTNGSMTIVYSCRIQERRRRAARRDAAAGSRWSTGRTPLAAQAQRAPSAGQSCPRDVGPLLDSALETVAGARVAAIATAHGHDVSAREARRRAMSGPLPSTAGRWFNPASSGVRGCERSRNRRPSALLGEAPIEESGRAADRLAGPRGSRDLREPGVIAGMSGSLLSHDALDELWQRPDPAVVTFAAGKPHRHLRAWHAGIRARLGPTATARTIFDGRRAIAPFPRLRRLRGPVGAVNLSPRSSPPRHARWPR